jgi:replicative DNA helicase
MDDVTECEYATVGALLWSPEQLPSVAAWLRVDDFSRSAAGLIYERALDLHRTGRQVGPQPIYDELRARGELGRDGGPVGPMIAMLETAPTRSAPVYARHVLAAALARRVEQAGIRLAQVSRRAGLEPVDLFGLVADERAGLAAVARRWQQATGAAMPTAHERRPPSGSERSAARRAVGDGGAAQAERATVGCLLLAPQLHDRLSGWLASEDFATRAPAVVYARLAAMRADGNPVDPVTVHAQLRRHGELRYLRDPSDLRSMAAEAIAPVAVDSYARRVLAGSIARHADAAGARLRTAGRSRQNDAGDLLADARGELRGLSGERVRWRRAGGRETTVPRSAQRRLARRPAVPVAVPTLARAARPPARPARPAS